MYGSRLSKRWGAVPQEYDRFRPDYLETDVTTLLQETGIEPGDTVAEFGAGTGMFTRKLLERGIAVVAIEPDPRLYGATSKRLSTWLEDDSNRLIKGTAQDVLDSGILDTAFDGIVMASSRRWIDDADGLFQRSAREILRKATELRPAAGIAATHNATVGDLGANTIIGATVDIRTTV